VVDTESESESDHSMQEEADTPPKEAPTPFLGKRVRFQDGPEAGQEEAEAEAHEDKTTEEAAQAEPGARANEEDDHLVQQALEVFQELAGQTAGPAQAQEDPPEEAAQVVTHAEQEAAAKKEAHEGTKIEEAAQAGPEAKIQEGQEVSLLQQALEILQEEAAQADTHAEQEAATKEAKAEKKKGKAAEKATDEEAVEHN